MAGMLAGMRFVGIAIAVVVMIAVFRHTGDHQPVHGLGMTGGQSAMLAMVCAVTGIVLLARKK